MNQLYRYDYIVKYRLKINFINIKVNKILSSLLIVLHVTFDFVI